MPDLDAGHGHGPYLVSISREALPRFRATRPTMLDAFLLARNWSVAPQVTAIVVIGPDGTVARRWLPGQGVDLHPPVDRAAEASRLRRLYRDRSGRPPVDAVPA